MTNEDQPQKAERAPYGSCTNPHADGSYSNGRWKYDALEPPKDDLPHPAKRHSRDGEKGLEGVI